jgi:hypothetical protein
VQAPGFTQDESLRMLGSLLEFCTNQIRRLLNQEATLAEQGPEEYARLKEFGLVA